MAYRITLSRLDRWETKAYITCILGRENFI